MQETASAAAAPERWVRGYTPAREALLVRTTRALWMEMRRSLRRMQVELRSCGTGGEAPVLQGRARVQMMAAALKAMDADLRILLGGSTGEGEDCFWLGEFEQAMDRWVNTAVWDVKDYGTLPEGADLSDGRYFTRGYAAAVGALFEAFRDWGFAARWLSCLDFHSEVSDLERRDEELACINVRMGIRRKFKRQPTYGRPAGRAVAVREESRG